MWKKSGAWFYKEIPEYIKPIEDPELHSPLRYPKTSWQHYTKPETSNLAFSSKKPQQSRKEQYSSTIFHRSRINPSWLHRKVRLTSNNGYDLEDENADNSASDETQTFLNENFQMIPSNVASNHHIRISKRKEGQDVTSIIHRFAIADRKRITNNEINESHHATPSTSPRHSPVSSYGDDLSQNQSSILASESIDSGVVPSDHSVRLSKIPASANLINPNGMLIMENIDDNDDDDDDDNDDDDESGKHIKHSNYPQAITSFGIQKIFPSIEMHTILDQEFSSQIYGKKCFNPAAQQSSKKFEKQILLKN
ncbi:unnamed protein product [Wuchereria bancrofti]|uniref:Uncharacterized protein n=1 Tax=Wuchereria bancrofti TaxID=6293 RepID=A0A3P7EFN5_WUCBA|nr:unnamed protein product [Wuchereria bancrofti]